MKLSKKEFMQKRDEFAKVALQAIISKTPVGPTPGASPQHEPRARGAVVYADQIMKALGYEQK